MTIKLRTMEGRVTVLDDNGQVIDEYQENEIPKPSALNEMNFKDLSDMVNMLAAIDIEEEDLASETFNHAKMKKVKNLLLKTINVIDGFAITNYSACQEIKNLNKVLQNLNELKLEEYGNYKSWMMQPVDLKYDTKRYDTI